MSPFTSCSALAERTRSCAAASSAALTGRPAHSSADMAISANGGFRGLFIVQNRVHGTGAGEHALILAEIPAAFMRILAGRMRSLGPAPRGINYCPNRRLADSQGIIAAARPIPPTPRGPDAA